MSATIFWEPESPEHKSIGVGAPSWFLEVMERAGLALPCSLSSECIAVLRGMAATTENDPNPYAEIIRLIERHGTIRLWAQY